MVLVSNGRMLKPTPVARRMAAQPIFVCQTIERAAFVMILMIIVVMGTMSGVTQQVVTLTRTIFAQVPVRFMLAGHLGHVPMTKLSPMWAVAVLPGLIAMQHPYVADAVRQETLATLATEYKQAACIPP